MYPIEGCHRSFPQASHCLCTPLFLRYLSVDEEAAVSHGLAYFPVVQVVMISNQSRYDMYLFEIKLRPFATHLILGDRKCPVK